MKTRFFIICLIFSLGSYAQNLPKLSSGKIERIENFKSEYVQPRNVDVWLPDGYSTDKKYSVIYMHDGQMLFDSTQTWNHKEWKVDETVGTMITNNEIKECIVVGIWNTGMDRISEYMPTKFFNQLPDSQAISFSEKYCNKKNALGDNYLKFIVKELKPYIDGHYSTFTEKENTIIMGSSMGALISLYGICEYPETFGSAVCMSTAWLNFINYRFSLAAFNYLNENLPSPDNHKIYMDYGTGESDPIYVTTQNFVDIIFKSNGFSDANYQSKVYEKAIHDEIAWSKRLDIPLKFALKKTKHQKPSFGKIDFYENYKSNFVTPRNIEVWLPENYSSKKKYSVLYMHDGQMLFDSTTTWNHQAWNADDVATRLMKEKKVQDFIIVGVWNGGETRHKDYFPQKPFENLTSEQKEFVSKQLQTAGRTKAAFQPVSDYYLKFLVTELKPFIDKQYSVYPDKKHTFIAGSSMGGLISMYAVCEYPDVFGGAACLSTHWSGIFTMENNPIPNAFFQYLRTKLPLIVTNKLYFDYGNKTLDALYPPLQAKVDSIMNEIKSKNKKNIQWKTQFFPGKDHSEKSWNERLDIPLEFLLNKK